jgi:hypothetical protein
MQACQGLRATWLTGQCTKQHVPEGPCMHGQVLRTPAAATVVAAARGSGLDDLKTASAPVSTAVGSKTACRTARKQSTAAGKRPGNSKLARALAAADTAQDGSQPAADGAPVTGPDTDADVRAAEAAQAEARRAWSAFAAAAAAAAQLPSAAPAAAAGAGADAGQGQYLPRLPALAQRLGDVLQGTLYSEPAADVPLIEGAAAVHASEDCEHALLTFVPWLQA